MFEIKIDDARYWKTIVNSIVSLIDEGTFKITKEGITLRATDAGGISMIIFNIPNKAFSKYNVDKNVSVGLNLDNFAKILASARDGEFLVMKDTNNRFTVEFGSKSSRRSFKLPMIEVSNDPEREPKVEFESFVELRGDSLKEILKDASLLSSYVGFKTEKNSFGIRAKGDAGELEEEHPENAEADQEAQRHKAVCGHIQPRLPGEDSWQLPDGLIHIAFAQERRGPQDRLQDRGGKSRLLPCKLYGELKGWEDEFPSLRSAGIQGRDAIHG